MPSHPASSQGARPLIVRPVFVPLIHALGAAALALLVGAGGAFLVGGVAQASRLAVGPGWLPFMATGWGIAGFLFGAAYHTARRTWAGTEYRFHRDRIEYREGRIGPQVKTVPFSQVRSIHMRAGPLQRRHGVGTIVLSTPGTGPRTPGVIHVKDVPQPELLLARVKTLLDRVNGDPRLEDTLLLERGADPQDGARGRGTTLGECDPPSPPLPLPASAPVAAGPPIPPWPVAGPRS